MSDNGGLRRPKRSTSNLPLRAGKGWPLEGGVREPMIVKWPGVARPGSTLPTRPSSAPTYTPRSWTWRGCRLGRGNMSMAEHGSLAEAGRQFSYSPSPSIGATTL